MCAQTISATSLLQVLMAMPGESDDKWSLSCNLPPGGWMELAVWLEGGETRREEAVGERGGG